MNKILTIAACLTLTAFLQSQTTIRVTPDGSGNGASWATACNLENAVKTAVSGDQIWMQFGTYNPTKMLVIPASVKIYGGFSGTENNLLQRNLSANVTIIDGQQKIGSIFRLEKAAELYGLTIQNGNANGTPQRNGGGVWADENCVIANCIITNNTAVSNGGGIYANGKVKIINSTVENNIANGSGTDLFGNCVVLGSEQSGMSSGIDIVGCNPSILYLGEVSFKSNETVPITFDGVTLTWSDAVIAEGCNKTTYYGGASGSYYSDCRANNTRAAYGDLFSWCAVARFSHVLCPAPWRAPTKEDFYHLDKAMGGNGDGSGPGTAVSVDAAGKYYVNTIVRNKYLAWNSNAYGGVCDAAGAQLYQGTHAYFRAQSEHSAERGFNSHFDSYGGIRPQGYDDKFYGFTLRCVR